MRGSADGADACLYSELSGEIIPRGEWVGGSSREFFQARQVGSQSRRLDAAGMRDRRYRKRTERENCESRKSEVGGAGSSWDCRSQGHHGNAEGRVECGNGDCLARFGEGGGGRTQAGHFQSVWIV